MINATNKISCNLYVRLAHKITDVIMQTYDKMKIQEEETSHPDRKVQEPSYKRIRFRRQQAGSFSAQSLATLSPFQSPSSISRWTFFLNKEW